MAEIQILSVCAVCDNNGSIYYLLELKLFSEEIYKKHTKQKQMSGTNKYRIIRVKSAFNKVQRLMFDKQHVFNRVKKRHVEDVFVKMVISCLLKSSTHKHVFQILPHCLVSSESSLLISRAANNTEISLQLSQRHHMSFVLGSLV